jgi:hypothetical protein
LIGSLQLPSFKIIPTIVVELTPITLLAACLKTTISRVPVSMLIGLATGISDLARNLSGFNSTFHVGDTEPAKNSGQSCNILLLKDHNLL